jgi:hypothetical protein
MSRSRSRTQENVSLDLGAVVVGLLLGMVIGGAIALVKLPSGDRPMVERLGDRLNGAREQVQSRVERARPGDALAESLAAGKAAAQRRLAETNPR